MAIKASKSIQKARILVAHTKLLFFLTHKICGACNNGWKLIFTLNLQLL